MEHPKQTIRRNSLLLVKNRACEFLHAYTLKVLEKYITLDFLKILNYYNFFFFNIMEI